MPDWRSIMPGTGFSGIFGNHYIVNFQDKTHVIYHFGIPSKMIQNTTIHNPVEVNGVIYQCELVGSGNQEHYGNVNILVICDSGSGHLREE